MDLSTLKTAERKVDIIHPGTGDILGVKVGLVHVDDDRLTKVKRQITDRSNYLAHRGKTFKAEEIEENRRLLIYTAMTGWEWYNPTGKIGDRNYDEAAMPDFHGIIPEFTKKDVYAVITELAWFGDQITENASDIKGFFGQSNSI